MSRFVVCESCGGTNSKVYALSLGAGVRGVKFGPPTTPCPDCGVPPCGPGVRDTGGDATQAERDAEIARLARAWWKALARYDIASNTDDHSKAGSDEWHAALASKMDALSALRAAIDAEPKEHDDAALGFRHLDVSVGGLPLVPMTMPDLPPPMSVTIKFSHRLSDGTIEHVSVTGPKVVIKLDDAQIPITPRPS